MKKHYYIALGAIVALIVAVRLHVPPRWIFLALAAGGLYFAYPALNALGMQRLREYSEQHGSSHNYHVQHAQRIVYVALALLAGFVLALRFHVKGKVLLAFLAAAAAYVYYPWILEYYRKHAWQPDSHDYDKVSGTNSYPNLSPMRPLYIGVAMVAGFALAYEWHLKFIMYPLAGVIFYLYAPMAYVQGKKAWAQYRHFGAPDQYFAYLWFSAWLSITCVLAYMLAHLLADVIASFHGSFLHYLVYVFLAMLVVGLAWLAYLQWNSKRIEFLGDIRNNFVLQGRLASFEVLFAFLVLFMLKH